tara:strand:- start:72 stop:296 length:225 start_codon:yes stop_codon:yes gene_type:complete
MVKKINTEINQKNENSNNELAGLFILLLFHLNILRQLRQILINKNGVKGKEAIHKTIRKNHQGSPCEFTTEVNL